MISTPTYEKSFYMTYFQYQKNQKKYVDILNDIFKIQKIKKTGKKICRHISGQADGALNKSQE